MGISVIIPAYNARRFLGETLSSIGMQTLKPDEVLIIDDFSTEPVDDLVEHFSNQPGYPATRLIVHQSNRGQAAARNTGISESTQEYLAFIDSDDVWAPNHLRQAIELLRREGADLVFSPAVHFRERIEQPLPFVERPMNGQEIAIEPLALFRRCYIIMSSVVLKKSAISDLNGFDESESMRAVEDFDLFMRMLKSGKSFKMCPEATLFYRKHPDAATAQGGKMAYHAALVRQKHFNHIGGNWFTKRSIVAYFWWLAWLTYLENGQKRWDMLARALWSGLPVPHQIIRGLVRTLRRLSPK